MKNYIRSSSETTTKSPIATIVLYGISISFEEEISRFRFLVWGVASLRTTWISSPVLVSKLISFTWPRRLPSFVTTSLPMISLNGFLSGMLV